MLIRRCFPDAPLKYMPPTKHKETDIFFSHAYDVMADLVAIWTRQGIQLLGMMTEAMHTPLLADRYVALKSAAYIHRAARGIENEFTVREDGVIAKRAREVFSHSLKLLEECKADGMVAAIGRGRFGDVKRLETGGKGLDGVLERGSDYFNPFLEILEAS
jgi:beta-lysine 5,6-aminomutase alpha subunit